MKKKITLIITGLAITIAGSAFAEMDHSMHSNEHMSGGMKQGEHDEMKMQSGEMGMKMSEGMAMKTLQIDDYKLAFHIMDMPAYHKLMKTMGMKHSQMEGDTSHHIMVDIAGKDGKKIEGAVVKIKLIDPRKKSQEKLLKPMMGQLGQYGADFKMIHKGKYQIITLFKIGGKKHKGGYRYEMK